MAESGSSTMARPISTPSSANFRRCCPGLREVAMAHRRIRPPFVKRSSRIHGIGVFATRRIRAGRNLIAYLGRVLTEAEVRARYMDDDADDPHTFLFGLGDGRYVDAGVGGNDARFINHSCDPNCEPRLSDGVIWIC